MTTKVSNEIYYCPKDRRRLTRISNTSGGVIQAYLCLECGKIYSPKKIKKREDKFK